MTTQETTYTFKAYDAQLPIVVEEGTRVVKCLYKETKDKVTGKVKKAGENSYIKVPVKHISVELVEKEIKTLAPIFVQYLQAEEDKIIKEAHKGGSIGFGDSFFSLSKVIEAIEAEAQGNRLTTEAVHVWFGEEVEELLLVAVAEKLGIDSLKPTDAELAKLQLIADAYKAKFGSLASGKTHYRKEEAELLQKALEVTGAKEGLLGQKFYSRLEGMKNTTTDDLLLSL